MDHNRFSILGAVKNAYVFVGKEWLYLLQIGLLPMLLQIGTSLFLQFQREDASRTESYLWSMPATGLFAWFIFLEIRLLLLGEKLDQLPRDPAFLRDRMHLMKRSVMTSLLFNMAMSATLSLLIVATQSGQWGVDWPITLAGLFLMGALFWGLRLSIAPILAAVHYPLRPVLEQIRGMMFSLRLVSMGLLCLFPLALLFQIMLAIFIDRPVDLPAEIKLTVTEQITLIVMYAPFSLIVTALLNAAVAEVLKQLLGTRKNEGQV